MILLLLFFWVVTPFGFIGRCSLLIIGVPFSGEGATVYRQLREGWGGRERRDKESMTID
jgi:hypothetical protein